MKINYSSKNLQDIPLQTTQLVFKEKKSTQLKQYENGQTELIIETQNKKDLNLQKIIYLFRSALRTAKSMSILDVGIDYNDIKETLKLTKLSENDTGFLFALNSLLADFTFDQRKTNKDSREKELKKITLFGKVPQSFKNGVTKGTIAGEEINKARVLCNTPGTELLPSILAKSAKEASKNLNIKVTVLDKKKITSLKMGGVLGVSRGASDGPFFIIMEYTGTSKNEKPIALVGKGITFDTGGINLKLGKNPLGMHMDMSGGGAVIHTVTTASRLKLKVNLVAVIPAVENVVAGESYKPGDFLTTMSGKTVEVINTDAEGRLILADALTFVKRFKPKTVIDVATLTGAAMISLGDKYSALFTNDENLKNNLIKSGLKTGERLWHLPMSDEYTKEMKGTFTDLVNAGSKSPYGGASTASSFLKEFVDYTDLWAHIDIAPRMLASDDDNLAKGSVGAPISLLIDYLTSIEK